MTKTEMIHTVQEGNEWSVAARQIEIATMDRRRKDRRREERREQRQKLEERNEALRNMLNRK